jgi:hypothetical protein
VDAPGLKPGVAGRERYVHPLAGKARIQSCRLQHRLAGGECVAHLILEGVDRRTRFLARLRCHAAKRGEQGGDAALLAKRGDTHRLQSLLGLGGGNLGQQAGQQGGMVRHREPFYKRTCFWLVTREQTPSSV